MKKHIYAGFSLLELILAIGIMAILLPSAGALFYSQMIAQREHESSTQQIDIINDFHAFTQIQSFDDIKRLSEHDTPLYIIENDRDGIISREFVPRDEWIKTDESSREYYTVAISQVEDLFDDDNDDICSYLPLMCKLSKLTSNDEQVECAAFVTVKIY